MNQPIKKVNRRLLYNPWKSKCFFLLKPPKKHCFFYLTQSIHSKMIDLLEFLLSLNPLTQPWNCYKMRYIVSFIRSVSDTLSSAGHRRLLFNAYHIRGTPYVCALRREAQLWFQLEIWERGSLPCWMNSNCRFFALLQKLWILPIPQGNCSYPSRL